jgi:hypothetical protein
MPSPPAAEIWSRKAAPPRIGIAAGIAILLAVAYLLAYSAGVKGIKIYNGSDDDTSGRSTGEPASRSGTLIAALAALPVALVLTLGRKGIVIDRKRLILTRWYGLLVPFSKHEFPLHPFHRIRVIREFRTDSEATGYYYPVQFVGADNAALTIEDTIIPDRSRELARELALFLGWPWDDLKPYDPKDG